MTVSAPDDPLLGRTLGGRYRLERRLGEGGMGAVYAATQLDLGRPVAVKVLFDDTPEGARRLRLEALAAARLQSPHVVAIFDFQHHDGEPPVLVMERLEGCPLAEALRLGGPMTPVRAARIALQVLAGLEVAHDAGVIHRDLKPSNVWLAPGNEAVGPELVKVLDFGIARFDHEDRIRTTAGKMMGTTEWLSPEQLRGLPVDARSDLHAVGLLLYVMLAGRLPWNPTTARSVFLEILEIVPPSLDTLVPGVTPALAALVARLLAKDPAARFPDAASVSAALVAAAPQSGAEPSVGAEEHARRRPPEADARGRTFLLGVLVPLVVAMAFAAGLVASRRGAREERPLVLAAPTATAPSSGTDAVAPTVPEPDAAPSAAVPELSLNRRPVGHAPSPSPSQTATPSRSQSPARYAPAHGRHYTPYCACYTSTGETLCDPPAEGPSCECDTAERTRICLRPLGPLGGCDSNGRTVPTPKDLVVGSNDQRIACEGWVKAPGREAEKVRGTIHCYWCYQPRASAAAKVGEACRGITSAGSPGEGVVRCE